MCLSIPYKIININKLEAEVKDYSDKIRKIQLNIIPQAQVGDWVLVLNNMATEIISQQEADQIINLYNHE